MNISNINTEVLIFIIAQSGGLIWWLSKTTTIIKLMTEKIDAMQKNNESNIASLWKRQDELRERIERVEKSCLINHSHKKENDTE